MEPLLIILLLFVGAVVMGVAELLLPTGGLLGGGAVLCVLGAIGVCFTVNGWLGLVVLVASVIATPFIFNYGIELWQRTPIGKRAVLTNVAGATEAHQDVPTGTTGTALTALRPMGEVVIGPRTYQATTAAGFLMPGASIRVLSDRDGLLTVEQAQDSSETQA